MATATLRSSAAGGGEDACFFESWQVCKSPIVGANMVLHTETANVCLSDHLRRSRLTWSAQLYISNEAKMVYYDNKLFVPF